MIDEEYVRNLEARCADLEEHLVELNELKAERNRYYCLVQSFIYAKSYELNFHKHKDEQKLLTSVFCADLTEYYKIFSGNGRVLYSEGINLFHNEIEKTISDFWSKYD